MGAPHIAKETLGGNSRKSFAPREDSEPEKRQVTLRGQQRRQSRFEKIADLVGEISRNMQAGSKSPFGRFQGRQHLGG
jgi:hypothetical protein